MVAPHEALVVPPALRKSLLPRRSVADTAKPLGAIAAKKAIAKIHHAAFVKDSFGDGKSHAKIFRAGAKHITDKAVRTLHDDALALLEKATEETLRAASIDTLAAAKHLLQRSQHDIPLLGVCCILRGIADGLRVLRRSLDFTLTAGSGGWTTAVWLTDEDVERDDRLEQQWLDVRHFVCAAPDKEYAELVALARSLRKGASIARRAPFAFVFPDEPWANEDLAHRDYLLSAASDVAAVRAASTHGFSRYALDLVHGLPAKDFTEIAVARLPELLKRPSYGPIMKTPPRQIAQALACLRTKDAAAALAPYASNAILSVIVTGFFRDAPELAAVPAAEPKARAAAGKTPAFLEKRPWRAGPKRPASPPLALERMGLELERVVLPTYEKAAGGPPMNANERDEWRREAEGAIAKKGYFSADYTWGFQKGGPREIPADDSLWAWSSGCASLSQSEMAFVARHGLAAIPGFVKKDWIRDLGQSEDRGEYLFAVMCFVSPRVAPKIARVAARRKKYRRVALAWLESHAVESALGLVPDALGEPGEARTDAEAALLALARRGHKGAIESAAKRYGAAAARAMDGLLARDPLSLDVTPPKRPDFLRVRGLPHVKLAKGGVLDDDGVDALVELLQVLPKDEAYPGLGELACEPASLAAFALAILEEWVLGDAPGRHEWMLHAIVHLPSPAAERRLAALAREWARKSQEKAKRACEALASLGTDFALSTVAHIADTTRFDALHELAATMIEDAATARALTPEELADRTVPDVGLDANGTLTLSYGPRRFVVSLDETLHPVPSSLPRPRKEDDASLAKAARERFDLLKADLTAAATREPRRLERAMTDGRTWSAEDFRAQFAHHPLIRHLARRLVWAAISGQKRALFRVAEDGALADAEEDAFVLTDAARVRLAHPASDPELLVSWPRVFGDYEIIQPFEQLGREVSTITKSERNARALERLSGITIAAKKAIGMLEARGFRRENAGQVSAFVKKTGSLTIRLPISPGFEIDMLAHAPEQTTVAPTLSGGATFGALDAVSFSELVRDVEALRR